MRLLFPVLMFAVHVCGTGADGLPESVCAVLSPKASIVQFIPSDE